MPNPGMTVFERAMSDYYEWEAGPRTDRPPAYPIYDGRVVAVLDLFAKFPGQVVVFPRSGTADTESTMFDLPDTEAACVDHTVRVIGRKMMDALEGPIAQDKMRVIRHEEGFAVPTHPHVVMFPAARGEGVKLYQPSGLELPDGYFERTQDLLTLSQAEQARLDVQLAYLAAMPDIT